MKYKIILLAILCAWVPLNLATAQRIESDVPLGGELEIKVLGDRILARVELQTKLWFKDTHVIIDYASPYALQINRNVIQSIQYGPDESTMKILNQEFRLEIPRSDIIQEKGNTTSEITARYDNELNQIDIVAIVGWPALRSFIMTMDIQENLLRFDPQDALTVDEVQQQSEVFVNGVELVNDSVFIPVNYNDNSRAFMKFHTGAYHTVLNREVLVHKNQEAASADDIYFGRVQEMKLSEMAALYPQDVYRQWTAQYEQEKAIEDQVRQEVEQANAEFPKEFLAHSPDEPSGDVLLVSGLSLLSGFRVVLNPQMGYVGLSRTLDNNYSSADHAFYTAAAAAEESQLFDYLKSHPEDRNIEEAVSILFNLGLENRASIDRQLSVVQFGIDVNEERRKFSYVSNFPFTLFSDETHRDEFTDLIIALGEKALEYVARSESPRLRQQVQMILGDRHLARNEAESAWRYFLSAAFNSDPRLEAMAHYDLGRAYEALGRIRRAYANYERALDKADGLPPPSREGAEAALVRLQPQLDEDDPLLLDAQSDG